MRRRDADDGHALARTLPPGTEELEREDTRAADDAPFSNAACMRSSGKLCVKRSALARALRRSTGRSQETPPRTRRDSRSDGRRTLRTPRGRTAAAASEELGRPFERAVRSSRTRSARARARKSNAPKYVRARSPTSRKLELGLVVGPCWRPRRRGSYPRSMGERVAYRESWAPPPRIRARAQRGVDVHEPEVEAVGEALVQGRGSRTMRKATPGRRCSGRSCA